MKWSVTNCFGKVLYDPDGVRCARIKQTAKGYFALDLLGGEMVSVCRVQGSHRYEIIAAGRRIAAELFPAKDQPVPWFRVPRADTVQLEWDGMPVQLKQLENRDFRVTEGAAAGSIQGMLGIKARIETTLAKAEWAALLYILAHIMLHEDDVETV